jgi:hypothetical protein
MQAVDALIKELRRANPERRAAIREKLVAISTGEENSEVREYVARAAKGEVLEIQWELEEIVDLASPPKKTVAAPETPATPEPEPEPAPEPNKRLGPKDLVLVYDDPRGLMIHKTKVGKRWFVTQVDPRTSQPQTFELHAQEVEQLKTQLQGSPYWVLGATPD